MFKSQQPNKLLLQIDILDERLNKQSEHYDVSSMKSELLKLRNYIEQWSQNMTLERREKSAEQYYLIYNKMRHMNTFNNYY